MSQAETRSIGRAAVLLLVVSLARLGLAHRPLASPPAGAPPAEGLLARSRVEASQAEARSRPLGPGERLDPNRAPATQLDRLPGIGEATARAWVASRESDGPFHAPDELTRVRGIGPATVERLRLLLDFSRAPRPRPEWRDPVAEPPPGADTTALVDLNHASEQELQRLPGIGPALARRIVEARSDAPFRSPEELVRVRGIGAATLARLRDRVVVRK